MQYGKSNVPVSSRFISLIALFFPSFFSLLIFIFSFSLQTVLAHPQGGDIVAGQGTINQTNTHGLANNQNPGKGIINRQGMNIGGPEAVPLIQHGADSGALNQVFSKRNDNLFKDPAKGLVSCPNQGTINASLVGFAATSIISRGPIQANVRSISLDSGEAPTLDFIGDNLINFAITEEVEGTATDAEGNVLDYNISNEGIIQANGGQVTLSVRRAEEIVKSVVNQSGVIEARTVIEREGRIYLSGDDSTLAKNTFLSSTWNTTKEEEGEEQQRQLRQGINAGFNFLDDFATSNSNCIYALPLPLVPLIKIEFPISWPERPTELESDNPRHYKIDPDCILFNPALR